ncbi:MAG TPA: Nramp family divalent metal transporter [Gemmatimonadales bacterium]|jgi:Mn2+/Fe2+ NRAMP family transporter
MKWRGVGPGAIVAAAFIGPGTVTTATLAGARHGMTLLWALLFATLATIVLQEMSARLGLTTGAGLGHALRAVRGPRWLGITLAALAAMAIVSGVAAYEAGNLTGASLGLESATGVPLRLWIGIGTVVAGLLLWSGRYRWLERVLAGCVAIMGIVFLATAVMVTPHLGDIFAGFFVPRMPAGAELTAMGLVGTTIVPYNLFLHAAAVQERFGGPQDLAVARLDLVLAIGLGGVVSAAIVVTASAGLGGGPVESAADMAGQLEPLLGPWARVAFATGLAAAGVSSAITAPLAAAYTVLDTRGHGRDIRRAEARVVWAACVVLGGVIAFTAVRPIPLILFAQVVNGLILPGVTVVLLIAMNDRSRLGAQVNGWKGNLAGGIVAALTLVLGLRAVVGAF